MANPSAMAPPIVDETFHAAKTEETVQDFLSRPVRVAQINWAMGVKIFQEINPWDLFFNDPKVNARLINFAYLRCKLCVDFIVNGNHFTYGKLLAYYRPLHNYDRLDTPRDATFQSQFLIPSSQRRCCYITPGDSTGACMELPFVWFNSALAIPLEEWSEMGEIDIVTMNELKHANGSEEPLTVSVWVHAVDVELEQPTSAVPELQAELSDEGMISAPATTAAEVSSALSTIPMLAPYAKAGEMFFKMTAGVAKLFGMSRPTLTQVERVEQQSMALESTIYSPSAARPIGLDAKKGVTIDPRTVGCGPEDDMSFSHIVQKESYLTTFEWKPEDHADKLLFQAKVTPQAYDTFGTLHYWTPSCMVASLFKYWKGSMHYRFDVVKSKLMTGRLRIVYDPWIQKTPETNVNRQVIVDLCAEESDFNFTVGWGSRYLYLKTENPGTNDAMYLINGSQFDKDPEAWNGVISVYVETELSTTSLENPGASVNVFTKMGSDFDFIEPRKDVFQDFLVSSETPEEPGYALRRIPPAVTVTSLDYAASGLSIDDSNKSLTDMVLYTGGINPATPDFSTNPQIRMTIPCDIKPGANAKFHPTWQYKATTFVPTNLVIELRSGGILLQTIEQILDPGQNTTRTATFDLEPSDISGDTVEISFYPTSTVASILSEAFYFPLDPSIFYEIIADDSDKFEFSTPVPFTLPQGWEIPLGENCAIDAVRDFSPTHYGAVLVANTSGSFLVEAISLSGFSNSSEPLLIPRRFLHSKNRASIITSLTNPLGFRGYVAALLKPTLQAELTDTAEVEEQVTPVTIISGVQPQNANLICAGEHVSSFRSLLKRPQYMGTFDDGPNATNFNSLTLKTIQPRVGLSDPQRLLLDFIKPAFLLYRGSLNVAYFTATQNGNTGTLCSISREASRGYAFSGSAYNASTPMGCVNVPWYHNQRALSARLNSNITLPYHTDLPEFTFNAVNVNGTTWVSNHVLSIAAGEDFSLFWFQCVPELQYLP